jgi:hypothetical protein
MSQKIELGGEHENGIASSDILAVPCFPAFVQRLQTRTIWAGRHG